MNKNTLIAEGYDIFSTFARPEQFHTNLDDPEFNDHERLLQSRDLHTLDLEDVACGGYNPITSISPEGMGYFMPRLIELALDIDHVSKIEREPYLWEFILQLMPGMGRDKFVMFQNAHSTFICKVLTAIGNEYMEFMKRECFEEEFQLTLNAWCK